MKLNSLDSPTWRIICATLLGVAIGAVVAVGGNFETVARRTPSALAWLTLIATQGALAGFLLPDAISGYRQALASRRGIAFLLAFAGLLAGVFAIEPIFFPLQVRWPLMDHFTRVTIVSGTIGASGLGMTAGVWAVAEKAIRAQTRTELFELRASLRQCTGFLGLQVGGAVLSTGLLRHTMIDGHYATEASFPPELVVSYGAYFSALVALAYMAAASPLDKLAGKIAADVLAAPLETAAWLKLRADVAKLLGLERSVSRGLTEGISILAPLVGSLLSIAIPHSVP